MRTLVSVLALATASTAFAICAQADFFTSATGTSVVTGDTTGGTSSITASCGAGTDVSPDQQVEFTATVAGEYTFTTDGTAHDTVMSAISTGDCATELDCDDDGGADLNSLITLNMAAGETVLLNIDGYNGAAGPWLLNVTYAPPAVCASDFSLGSALGAAVATGDTTGATNDFDGTSCAFGMASPDIAYSWTAPAADTYTFSLAGSAYDTGITIQSTTCTELACNDDLLGLTSEVAYTAAAGETVFVVVDGFGSGAFGAYTLGIYDSSTCSDIDADGVCDAADACTGDDASGDSDSDGTCDDQDFTLQTTTFTAGSSVTLGVQNAEVGSRVVFLLSLTGPGAGPCHPTAGICADILGPIRILGTATASAAGTASISLTIPAAAAGRRVAVQAAYIGTDADVSDVEQTTVQ